MNLAYFKKEWKEYIRNWKSSLLMLLLPLFIFPVSIALPVTMLTMDKEETPFYFKWEGEENTNVTSLLTQHQFQQITKDEQEDILLQGTANDSVTIHFNSNKKESRYALEAIEQLFINQQMASLTTQIIDLGEQPEQMLQVQVKDQHQPSDTGLEIATYFVPMGILLMVVLGGIVHGSATVSGEKDRNTIQTSLLLPLSRSQIILIKYLVTVITNILTVISSYTGIVLAFIIITKFTDKVTFDFTSKQMLMSMYVAFLACFLYSAIHVCLSILAKDLKEVQTFSTIIGMLLLFIALGLGNLLVDKAWLIWLPIANQAFLLSQIFHEPIALLSLIIYTISTLSITIGVVYLMITLFKKERFAFKQ